MTVINKGTKQARIA